MEQPLIITKELLVYLQEEGYQALLKKFRAEVFIALKEDMELLIDTISMVPMAEDQLIRISDAIEYYDELELSKEKVKLE